MAFRCNSGTAGCIHQQGDLRQGGLQNHGIGDHADIRTQPYQLNAVDLLKGCHIIRQFQRAEGGLVDDPGIFHRQLGRDLPAGGSFHTVDHRQILPLLGVRIIIPVGIPGKHHRISSLPVLSDLFRHCRHNFNSLRGTQSPINKIILHIDHNQYFHFHTPFLSKQSIVLPILYSKVGHLSMIPEKTV